MKAAKKAALPTALIGLAAFVILGGTYFILGLLSGVYIPHPGVPRFWIRLYDLGTLFVPVLGLGIATWFFRRSVGKRLRGIPIRVSSKSS